MGSCALEEKQMCHPYACDAEAEACGQSCWNDNDCAAGFECLADECVEEETDPGDGASSGGGSGTSSGDGNGGDGACETGNEGCECFGNDTCNGDLSCLSGLCVDAGGEGEGDSDGNSNKDESEAAGCGCSTVGRDQFPRGSSLWFALALGGLLLWWRRGRLRRVVGAGSP